METKGQLIESVKEWVKLDNEIRNIQKIQNPTEQEMISILKSIMEDERTLDYIESIVARNCQ